MYTVNPEAYAVREMIEQSDKPIAVMGVGIPASGKSTLLEQVAWLGGPRSSVIAVDNIMRRFVQLRVGGRLTEYIDNEVYQQVEDNLSSPGIALIDDTCTEASRRAETIRTYRRAGATIVGAVFMDTPVETALERNAQRAVSVTPLCIQQMNWSMQHQLPDLSEGFDWIATVRPDHSVQIVR